jgi:hypothetical protein
MSNYPLIVTGQQAVTAAAVPLPTQIQPNPFAGSVRGEGFQLILGNLKASTASLYYGPAGVTTATGKEVPAGSQDIIRVNDPSQIFVIAAAPATATATWSVTNL